MTIPETFEAITSYFASYSPHVKIAQSGTVYICIDKIIIRISNHKRKRTKHVDFDIRTDWKKLIRRPVYSPDFMKVILKEIKIKLDKVK